VEGPNAAIVNRGHPLCEVPEIGIGNKPIDGGNYLFTSEEKEEFLRIEPQAAPFFRPWVGSDEFINGYTRWCLWLRDCTTAQLRTMPEARKRIQAVRKFRLASKSAPTRKIAERPTHFHVENMPSRSFLVIPKVSSEERAYIPMGFVSPETLVSDLCFILPSATLFHFGVLTSAMHMAWVRHVCGRLKSDFRYSAKLVYNNFPWPAAPTDKQRARVELTAGRVLDVRASYLGGWAESLADLYEPLLSPTSLLQAHNALNRAVDRCYRAQSFKSDTDRISFLFELYDKYTTALIPASHPGPKRRR
jgi:hypothetical protein